MEDSHFNSQYFWSPVPVQGQIENAMFLKQLKDQEKNTSFPSSHYQTTLLTVPKQEGGGQGQGGHQHPPHTQNITVVPVPSTGIMTAAGLVITTPQGTQLVSPASSSQSFVSGHPTTMIVSTLHAPDKKQEGGTPQVVVMPTPSKRGRKKKSTLGRAGPAGGHTLSAGNEALILAHLASGGQVVMSSQHYITDPYDLANEDENHSGKDCNKTYRCPWARVFFSFSLTQKLLHCMLWQRTHLLKYFTMCLYLHSGTQCVIFAAWTHTFSASLMHPLHTHTHASLHTLDTHSFAYFCLLPPPPPLSISPSYNVSLLFKLSLFVFLFLASAESAIFPAVFTDFPLYLFPLPVACLLFFTSLIHFICSIVFIFLSCCLFHLAFSLCFPHLLSHVSPIFCIFPLSSSPLPISHTPVSLSLLFVFSSVSHLLLPSFPSSLSLVFPFSRSFSPSLVCVSVSVP
ncbi:zinc finger protein 384-like isoform X5 [Oncorhynchus clarkii lewisi]|uniref:zinc finger protein 384-like isoform X5 n=1 Tax=Oncorhynchus clarkii lewisi TaxID=490388 RepID=UPI0039B9AB74